MQPIMKCPDGVLRFKANSIVDTLLEEARKRGFGLNELVPMCHEAPQSDWEQFYQLIGYSISGYHELHLVSDEACVEASRVAKEIMPGAGGCRDAGCGMHSGVDRKAPFVRATCCQCLGRHDHPNDDKGCRFCSKHYPVGG